MKIMGLNGLAAKKHDSLLLGLESKGQVHHVELPLSTKQSFLNHISPSCICPHTSRGVLYHLYTKGPKGQYETLVCLANIQPLGFIEEQACS